MKTSKFQATIASASFAFGLLGCDKYSAPDVNEEYFVDKYKEVFPNDVESASRLESGLEDAQNKFTTNIYGDAFDKLEQYGMLLHIVDLRDAVGNDLFFHTDRIGAVFYPYHKDTNCPTLIMHEWLDPEILQKIVDRIENYPESLKNGIIVNGFASDNKKAIVLSDPNDLPVYSFYGEDGSALEATPPPIQNVP